MTLADLYGRVVILAVAVDTPASRVRMQAGDLILAVNGAPIRSAQEFVQQINAVPRWGRVRLEGLRGPDWQGPVVYEADLDR